MLGSLSTGSRLVVDMAARRVVIVGYQGAELLDIACLSSVFTGTERLVGRRLYEVELISPGGRPIVCDSGLLLASAGSVQQTTGRIDTLLISGGMGHEAAATDNTLVAHVRRLAANSRRVGSVCTGATVLAATGYLDGHRVTTHWANAAGLARRFPAVTVDPEPVYIRDGDIYTSAGITCALDLALALVQDDHGESLARDLARGLVTYLQRPGNQAQMSMFVTPDPPEHRLVRAIVDHIASHLTDPLRTRDLATRAAISERHLARLFERHTGTTPARYVRRARVEAAANLLTSTDLPVAHIAHQSGLGTTEALRQAFSQTFGITPTQYRRVHRTRPTTDHHTRSGPGAKN